MERIEGGSQKRLFPLVPKGDSQEKNHLKKNKKEKGQVGIESPRPTPGNPKEVGRKKHREIGGGKSARCREGSRSRPLAAKEGSRT